MSDDDINDRKLIGHIVNVERVTADDEHGDDLLLLTYDDGRVMTIQPSGYDGVALYLDVMQRETP